MAILYSCSLTAKISIQHALQCLHSNDIRNTNILFVCIDESDARRLVMENYIGYEIIVISEFIVPRNRYNEDHWSKRYFNFAILHEIAHAVSKHQSPKSITFEGNQQQEDQADDLAFEWFNRYLKSKGMNPFSDHELKESQDRIQRERRKYLTV